MNRFNCFCVPPAICPINSCTHSVTNTLVNRTGESSPVIGLSSGTCPTRSPAQYTRLQPVLWSTFNSNTHTRPAAALAFKLDSHWRLSHLRNSFPMIQKSHYRRPLPCLGSMPIHKHKPPRFGLQWTGLWFKTSINISSNSIQVASCHVNHWATAVQHIYNTHSVFVTEQLGCVPKTDLWGLRSGLFLMSFMLHNYCHCTIGNTSTWTEVENRYGQWPK